MLTVATASAANYDVVCNYYNPFTQKGDCVPADSAMGGGGGFPNPANESLDMNTFSILNIANLTGRTSNPLQVGDAGTTSHSLAVNDDLFVSGKLEVDGISFFDSLVTFLTTQFGGQLNINGNQLIGVRNITGDTSKHVQIGDAGTTSHALSANDDLLVTGKLEVNGNSFIDSQMRISDGVDLDFGDLQDATLKWNTAQGISIFDMLSLGLATDAKTFVITDNLNTGKDHDLAQQANPTVFIFSATDPDTSNTQWLSLAHDTNDGVIDLGSGNLRITSDLNMSQNSVIGASDVNTTNLKVSNVGTFTGEALFEGGAFASGGKFRVADDISFELGTGLDADFVWSTAQASAETLLLGLGQTSNSLIVVDDQYIDNGRDFDHGNQVDPTIIIHSGTDPDTDNTQYLSLTHDQTDAVISAGTGNVSITNDAKIENCIYFTSGGSICSA